MRDLFVAFWVFASLPFILYRPYIGVLVWSWLGYMNPHRLAYGFAVTYPFAQIVAVTTLIGLLFYKGPKNIPWTRETKVLLLLVIWMLFTTFFALKPEAAWFKWDKVWKVELFTFVTLILIIDRQKLEQLIWVIVLSIGFYGVKGGLFTITTGGNHLVLGPADSFLATRGEIGTALNMVFPLMRYLQLTTNSKVVRIGLGIAMALTIFAIIGTHSRGAFLAIVVVLFMLILKSRRKILLSVLLVATSYAVLNFMPEEWSQRMHTMETYQEDGSAMGRIEAWEFATDIANARPFVGGGFDVTAGQTAAHSIYFQMLGDHGYVGLALFLLLMVLSWMSASWVRRHVKGRADLLWAGDLVAMCQVSILGYAIGGAFISIAYFDFFYHLVAVIVICKVIVLKALDSPVESGTILPVASHGGRRFANSLTPRT